MMGGEQRGPDLATIRRALAEHEAREIALHPEGEVRQAAVAAVLRASSRGSEVLLIRRAEHPRDPWSGHMAFPGGRVDPGDEDAFAAALRETHEEIGLALPDHAERIGALSHVEAIARGGRLPLVIVPFVFELQRRVTLVLDEVEVQETVWVPLTFLLDEANRDTMDWQYAGSRLKLPCYRFEGRVIWGLTLRMLDELMAVVRAGIR